MTEPCWFVSKLFFDWIPHPLPAKVREDGGFVLVLPDLYPEVMYLNHAGAFIYRAVDGKLTVEDIVKSYMVEFLRGDRGPAAYEVVRALRQMEHHAAVVLMPPARFSS